jgi:hypothetical protein
MARTGRPRVTIDWEVFDKLCGMQSTEVEIAAWFNCSVDTIERAVKRQHKLTFAEYYKTKSARGKISLRRKQVEVALNGSVPMLIWLGKQHLGQKDRQELDIPPSNDTITIYKAEWGNASEEPTNNSD